MSPLLSLWQLSPKKTWEGFIGGFFSTVLFGLLVSGHHGTSSTEVFLSKGPSVLFKKCSQAESLSAISPVLAAQV